VDQVPAQTIRWLDATQVKQALAVYTSEGGYLLRIIPSPPYRIGGGEGLLLDTSFSTLIFLLGLLERSVNRRRVCLTLARSRRCLHSLAVMGNGMVLCEKLVDHPAIPARPRIRELVKISIDNR
jgi:hypothetical protein